jgi:hypothetical protein
MSLWNLRATARVYAQYSHGEGYHGRWLGDGGIRNGTRATADGLAEVGPEIELSAEQRCRELPRRVTQVILVSVDDDEPSCNERKVRFALSHSLGLPW